MKDIFKSFARPVMECSIAILLLQVVILLVGLILANLP